MPSLATPPVQLLLADDDAALRSLVAARACELVDALVVVEAGDGAEALQLGLQRQPQLALLDVNMPRLSGIDVAVTLLELRPGTRVALQTADPHAHHDRAREHGLPLFDKLDLERAYEWLTFHSESAVTAPPLRVARSLHCSTCGYGIVRERPLDRCPMCQGEGAWIHGSRPRVDGLDADEGLAARRWGRRPIAVGSPAGQAGIKEN